METNVMQKNQKRKLPAGIFEGVEAFWHAGEKWVITEGRVMRFHDAPGKVQRTIALAFLNDKKSRNYLRRMGYTAFSKAFDKWYQCVIGALDATPDFLEGKFTADAYNSECEDYDCQHRGRLCSLGPGLKNYEVATLSALKGGFSQKQTATMMYVTPAAMKSRVEKMKQKLEAKNTAEMIAKAVELGI